MELTQIILAIQSLGILAGLLWILWRWSKRDHAMIDRALIAYEQGLTIGAKIQGTLEPIGGQLPLPEPTAPRVAVSPDQPQDRAGHEEAQVIGRFGLPPSDEDTG